MQSTNTVTSLLTVQVAVPLVQNLPGMKLVCLHPYPHLFVLFKKGQQKLRLIPNALKNINKDYTLLHASIKGIINPNEGSKLSQRSRSLSMEFRNIDQERTLKLYRFDKDQAFRNDAFFFSTSRVILSLCYLSLFVMIFNFLELSHE